MAFTVATYNILADAYANPEWYPGVPEEILRAESRVPAIARHVSSLHADILCMQEVEPSVFATLSQSLEPLGYVGYFEQKGQDRPDGSATLFRKDRFQMRKVKRLEYRDEMHSREKHSGHVALMLALEHEGRLLGVANTHIRWGNRELPSAQQLGFRQVSELIEESRRFDPPCRDWVVCGDFNFAPETVVVNAMLGAGFSFAHAGRPHIRTAVANGRALLIDYIFHTPGLRPTPLDPPVVTDATKLPSAELPSDHLALVSEFDWGT